MSNKDASARAPPMSIDVDVKGDVLILAENARLKQEKGSQGDALLSDRRKNFKYLEHCTEEDQEYILELWRKRNTMEYFAIANELTLTLPSLVVDKGNQKIFIDGVGIRYEDLREVPIEYRIGLMKKIRDAKLIKDDGMMDEGSLLALVQNATDGKCQQFRPQRAARSTNMIQERLMGTKDCGEMFLQQVVFSPIAELFSSFDLSMYCAGKNVSCAHAVGCKNQQGEVAWNQVGCSPDAAIRLTKTFYLVAMMELNADDSISAENMYRCELMTCASLLALVEYLKTQENMTDCVNLNSNKNAKPSDQPMSKLYYEKLAIPYVVGFHDQALLYVTRVEMLDDKVSIVFSLLKSLQFCSGHPDGLTYNPLDNVKKKVEFMSTLAILVADILKIATRVSSEMDNHLQQKDLRQQIRKNLPNALG